MKTAIVCLMLVAAAQAVDWANIRPMNKVRPSILPRYTSSSSSGRVIGGTLATEGQFSYQVGIFMDDSWFCGGSLISDSVVLTAAHCVSGYSKWEVHCGALNIRDEQENGRVAVTTRDAIPHEDFGSFTAINDIAIVKLGQSVSGPNIASVRLPSRSMANDLLEGEVCRLSGWGKISDAAPGITDELRFVDLTIAPNSVCIDYYGSLSVRDTSICIDSKGGTESSCSGDSGGPLVFTEADGEVTEVGVVSFGSSAGCESGAPAVFARVASFLDWIETNSGIAIRP